MQGGYEQDWGLGAAPDCGKEVGASARASFARAAGGDEASVDRGLWVLALLRVMNRGLSRGTWSAGVGGKGRDDYASDHLGC